MTSVAGFSRRVWQQIQYRSVIYGAWRQISPIHCCQLDLFSYTNYISGAIRCGPRLVSKEDSGKFLKMKMTVVSNGKRIIYRKSLKNNHICRIS